MIKREGRPQNEGRQSSRGLLRRAIPRALKGLLRRHAGQFFFTREALEYQTWIKQRVKQREGLYTDPVPLGLFSILTPVWNGSPLPFLRRLADSLTAQNQTAACEWVILDNGCSRPALRNFLAKLAQIRWVKLLRVDQNVGIVRGLRLCLEQASGRYVLPVDADDELFNDTLRVSASFLSREDYPAIVYTDEDKITGRRRHHPYLKPDWDPVLFVNSAYIAHLSIVNRDIALAVGAYTDPATEGSADWDLFVRFVLAGYTPSHLPEVLYSWRIHASSTADHSANKTSIRDSQKAVLGRFLAAQPVRQKFEIQESPLSVGGTDWHFVRLHIEPRKIVSILLSHTGEAREAVEIEPLRDHPESVAYRISIGSDLSTIAALVRKTAGTNELVHLQSEDVHVEGADWPWEAIGLIELHPETVMVGGRIRTSKGLILSAGGYFGFGGACGCPHKGRRSGESGYFTQIWKQRSVSAVSSQFSVLKAGFLLDVLSAAPAGASLVFLGAWAGAHALRTGGRVVYSPFLSGISNLDWDQLPSPAEKRLFADLNPDLIPDRRFYSQQLSLEKPFALAKSDEKPMRRAAAV
jgi:glycosyltransferase involved in cell wall biosynthesis